MGGNSLVKMSDLRMCFEKMGFLNITTYINSGNVIFESERNDKKNLVEKIEKELLSTFQMALKIVLRSEIEIGKIIQNVPSSWEARSDIRCYVAFVKETVTVKEVIADIKINKDVDFVDEGPGVIYMTTLLSGLTRSGYSKFAGSKMYKEVTIRNYNTTRKILNLMKNGSHNNLQ